MLMSLPVLVDDNLFMPPHFYNDPDTLFMFSQGGKGYTQRATLPNALLGWQISVRLDAGRTPPTTNNLLHHLHLPPIVCAAKCIGSQLHDTTATGSLLTQYGIHVHTLYMYMYVISLVCYLYVMQIQCLNTNICNTYATCMYSMQISQMPRWLKNAWSTISVHVYMLCMCCFIHIFVLLLSSMDLKELPGKVVLNYQYFTHAQYSYSCMYTHSMYMVTYMYTNIYVYVLSFVVVFRLSKIHDFRAGDVPRYFR